MLGEEVIVSHGAPKKLPAVQAEATTAEEAVDLGAGRVAHIVERPLSAGGAAPRKSRFGDRMLRAKQALTQEAREREERAQQQAAASERARQDLAAKYEESRTARRIGGRFGREEGVGGGGGGGWNNGRSEYTNGGESGGGGGAYMGGEGSVAMTSGSSGVGDGTLGGLSGGLESLAALTASLAARGSQGGVSHDGGAAGVEMAGLGGFGGGISTTAGGVAPPVLEGLADLATTLGKVMPPAKSEGARSDGGGAAAAARKAKGKRKAAPTVAQRMLEVKETLAEIVGDYLRPHRKNGVFPDKDSYKAYCRSLVGKFAAAERAKFEKDATAPISRTRLRTKVEIYLKSKDIAGHFKAGKHAAAAQ